MKKKIGSFVKKQWLLLCMAAMLACLLGTFVAYAGYPVEMTMMKRVVASVSDMGMKFSSNILMEDGDKVYFPEYKEELEENQKATSTYDVDVYLRNYSTKDIFDWYKESIEYNLQFTLTNKKGEELTEEQVKDRTISVVDENGNPVGSTLNKTNRSMQATNLSLEYQSGKNTQHKYVLKFKGTWDLDKDEDICVRMKAIPNKTNGRYSELAPISAVIGLQKLKSVISSGWMASFNEHQNDKDERLVTAFDGYNLVLKGSGKATITIKWDTTKLTLNPCFWDGSVYSFGTYNDGSFANGTKEVGEPIYDGDVATLVLHVNNSSTCTGYRNRYNIQVYKKYEPSDWSFFWTGFEEPADWAAFGKYLTVTVTQAE